MLIRRQAISLTNADPVLWRIYESFQGFRFPLCSYSVLMTSWNVITWKRFRYNWPLVREIQQSPVDWFTKVHLCRSWTSVEQAVELPVFWDDMNAHVMSLLWHPDPLQRRHNERDGVSNQRRLKCLVDCLFRPDPRKHQSSASLAFVSPVPGEFPVQMASNAENFSIWWRHRMTAINITLTGNHYRIGNSHWN